MDFIARQQVKALGARLRRLVERLDRDVLAAYRAAGERFEPRWYAVFIALRDEGPLTVGELSQRLGVTHAAVSQVRSALEREGLVASQADPADGRRHPLALTPAGRATATRLEPLWATIAAASEGLLAEGAPALMSQLDDLDRALDRQDLKTRIDTLMTAGVPDDR